LAEELSQEVKCGALSEVNIMIFFFHALAVNESSRHINRMLDYIQKFSKIGYKLSNKIKGSGDFIH
jgi:hypothetical protein